MKPVSYKHLDENHEIVTANTSLDIQPGGLPTDTGYVDEESGKRRSV